MPVISSKQKKDEWHSNPKNWKFGYIYFNREDKRIFPPKKNKLLGWTINFANPISIVVFFLPLIIILLLLFINN